MIRRGLILVVLSIVTAGGCSAETRKDPDSETHWLRGCVTDDECGSLTCICGICSRPCSNAGECAGLPAPAACTAPVNACATAICDALCSETSDCSHLGSDFSCVESRCRLDGFGSDGGDPSDSGGPDGGGAPIDAAADTMSDDGGTFGRPPPDEPLAERADGCDFGPSGDRFVILADGDSIDIDGTTYTGGLTTVRVDETHAYYGSNIVGPCVFGRCSTVTRLYRMPRCGGPAELLATGPEDGVPGGGFVYWLTGNDLVRYAPETGDQEIVAEETCLGSLVANDTWLFAYDSCSETVVRFDHAQNTSVPIASAARGEVTLPRLALANSNLYFIDGTRLGWWSSATAQTGTMAELGGKAEGIVADHNAVMVLIGAGFLSYELVRVPFDGSGPEAVLGPISVRGLTIENGAAYASGPGGLTAVPTDDPASSHVTLARPIGEFDVYGGRIYWIQEGKLLTGRAPVIPATSTPELSSAVFERGYGGSAPEQVAAFGSAGDGSSVIVTLPTVDPQIGGDVLSTGDIGSAALARFDANGAHQWSRLVPAATTKPPSTERTPRCVAVADDGSTTVGVDEGENPDTPTPSLSHFTPLGALAWTRIGSEYDRVPACATDPAGNVAALFAPDLNWPDATPSGLHFMLFDTSGQPLVDTVLGTLDTGERLDPTHMTRAGTSGFAVAAQLEGSVDLGDGPLVSSGSPASVIARLAADGALVWSRIIRGSEHARVRSDADGRVVVLGSSKTFVDAGSGEQWVPRALEDFSFVAVYSAAGDLDWLRIFDGVATDIAVGPSGALYLTHYRDARPFLFGGPEPVVALSDRAWLAVLDAAGQFVSAAAMPLLDYSDPLLSVAPGRVLVARSVEGQSSGGSTEPDLYLAGFALEP